MKSISASVCAALALALTSLFLIGPAQSAPGDLDPAFGSNGVVSFNGGRAVHTPTGVMGQANGKYLVSFTAPVANGGGATGGFPGSLEAFGGGVARFNADHTLDTSWGKQGIAGIGFSVNGMAWSGSQLLTIEYGVTLTDNTIEDYPYVARYTAAGERDLTFGSGQGHTPNLSFPGSEVRFHAIAVAPDGKIVVAGSFNGDAFVGRFLANGTLDSSFGPGANPGVVKLRMGDNVPGIIHAVAVQPDGRIVFAGNQVSPARAFVARLTAAGALDPAFGTNGNYRFFAADDPSECRGLVADATRIVAACTVGFLGNVNVALFGINSAGTDDFSFDIAFFDLGGTANNMFGLFRHTNGRYFFVARGGAGNNQLAVVGAESNGMPAAGFGNNGIYMAPETDAGDGASIGWNGSDFIVASRRALAVNDDLVLSTISTAGTRTAASTVTAAFSHAQYVRPKVLADGRILAIGNVSSWSQGAFRVSRFLANGTLDTSFSGVGHTSFFTTDNWSWGARDFVLQPDGHIVISGGFGPGPPSDMALGLARVLGDGGLDPAFNPGTNAGQSSFSLPGAIASSTGRAVRLQADGKLVVASRYAATGTTAQMLAVRFNADGSRDMSYGSGGLARSAFAAGASNCRAMDLDASGRAVLFGDGSGQLRVIRFAANGVLDPTFGVSGMVSHPLPTGYTLLFTAAAGFVLPDGKLIAVLNATRGNDGVVGLVRLNADGTLDMTFGVGGFGFVTVAAGLPNNGNAFHAAIAPNGRIAIVGFGTKGSAATVPMVVRFMPNGRADADFGEGGVRYYTNLPESWMIGVDFAADGSMVIAGSTNPGGRIVPNIFRTVPDTNALGPNLVSVFSRKKHATYGAPFDLLLDPLPGVSGTVTTEPRAQGMGHNIVFRFDTNITSVGTVLIESANGASLSTVTPGIAGNDVVVPLPLVPDLTRVRIGLGGVNGLTSSAVSVGFMYGDISRNGRINASDIAAIKLRKGQSLGIRDNFAFDLDLSGTIDNQELHQVRQRSGTTLP